MRYSWYQLHEMKHEGSEAAAQCATFTGVEREPEAGS